MDNRRVQSLMHHITAGAPARTPYNKELTPFVQGGFQPVTQEITVENLSVIGKLPIDLDGQYIKNGPNSFFLPQPGQPYHWFDGDGMVHAVRIKEGKALNYTNKFIKTKRLIKDRKRGDTVYNMGEMSRGNLRAILDKRAYDDDGKTILGRLNTNVVFHGRRLLALEETDKPYQLSVPSMDTLGQYTYGDQLKHIMCAHPKIDPVSGELFMFGHEIFPGKYFTSYTVVNRDGSWKSTLRIAVRSAKFMHDMAITERFAVVFDISANFDFNALNKGHDPWLFDANMPAKFGIVPKYATDAKEVVWFTAKPCMIFHTINAFEDGDEVVLHCCRGNAFSMSFKTQDHDGNWLYPYEWRFNLKTGVTTERQLCSVRCDFPLVNKSVVGRKQRYSYYTTYRPRPSDNVPLYDGLLKFDHQTGQQVALIYLEKHLSAAEFSFVPRPNPTSEDDGYLVCFVYNEVSDSSQLFVYDAQTLNDASLPQAQIKMPQRVPYGFHGTWLTEQEMESALDHL